VASLCQSLKIVEPIGIPAGLELDLDRRDVIDDFGWPAASFRAAARGASTDRIPLQDQTPALAVRFAGVDLPPRLRGFDPSVVVALVLLAETAGRQTPASVLRAVASSSMRHRGWILGRLAQQTASEYLRDRLYQTASALSRGGVIASASRS